MAAGTWGESNAGSVSPSRGRSGRGAIRGALVALLFASGCSSERGPGNSRTPGAANPQGAGGSGAPVQLGEPRSGPLATAGSDSAPPTAPDAVVHVAPPAVVPPYVSSEGAPDRFPIASAGASLPILVSANEFPGVQTVAQHLRTDIGKVTGVEPALINAVTSERQVILLGTLGKSELVDAVVNAGKLDVSALQGQWETFVLQVVEAPLPGVESALVIAGSDKRGSIYGAYDLAQQIGVSPWYYWADVPVVQRSELHVLRERRTLGQPAVKYRGIFLNDEAPALSGWAYEKFGGFNHTFYEHVFELLLRLKGNYLWPAMWGRAFNAEDPENARLADELGVVMGTSHHEPMSRAQSEWNTTRDGDWNYQTNAATLRTFWQGGIQRLQNREAIITLGMRGDGDVALAPTADIALLEGIVADQRSILGTVTGRDVTTIPQVWTLYKEVQDYYDLGMRVPDDVTLMFSDDNWGNIRKLPRVEDGARPGGYGIYYHYDYVGGPRNYKWLNTSPISRTWEQMNLAYASGAKQIWIVNVGDLKPMEFPISFFLDYAWNPAELPAAHLGAYTERWAAQQFGAEHAAAIADLLAKYTKYNGRRKPELLAPGTYSLVDFREAETVVADYNQLAATAQALYDTLPAPQKDAYYQLVLFPILACANLNELYVTAGRNALYAAQGRAATNGLATRVSELFARDAELTRYYNQTLAAGKWNHIMDQKHIGYTDWQEPPQNNIPATQQIDVPAGAQMAVAIEGSRDWWPNAQAVAALPALSRHQAQADRYIEVYNRGQAAFDYTATSAAPWLSITPAQGNIQQQERLSVTVDWSQAPEGLQAVPITISGPNGAIVVVQASVDNRALGQRLPGFVEANGYVSIEAEHFTRAVGTDTVQWLQIPDLGRTLSAMTPYPVTAPEQTAGVDSPRLEYGVHLFSTGDVTVRAYASPSLNYHGPSLRYAVSIDEQPPQLVELHYDTSTSVWNEWVSANIIVTTSQHTVSAAGPHVLKFWMVDSGVVLQKLVVETAPPKASYLGPPESVFVAPEAAPVAPVPE